MRLHRSLPDDTKYPIQLLARAARPEERCSGVVVLEAVAAQLDQLERGVRKQGVDGQRALQIVSLEPVEDTEVVA